MTSLTFVHALGTAGIHQQELFAHAAEVILFGSRAAGCARQDSDWDVLVIGGPRLRGRHTGLLDLVWVQSASGHWLGTDLAIHAAHFGRWLHGEGDWRHRVRFDLAAVTKEAVLQRDLRQLVAYWNRLSEHRRLPHARRVRRNAQRLMMLRRSVPVPPTAWLDRQWNDLTDRGEIRSWFLENMHVPDDVLMLILS